MFAKVVFPVVVAVFVALISHSAERPVEVVVLGEGGYDITPFSAPVATGLPLRILSSILASEWLGPLVCRILINDNGFHLVRELGEQTKGPILHWPLVRVDAEVHATHAANAAAADTPVATAAAKSVGSPYWGVLDYERAYRDGSSTPVAEVQRSLSRARDTRLQCFVAVLERSALEEAARSARRWAEGTPLGPFDGVPFVVKDEVAVAGTVLGDGFAVEDRKAEVADDLTVARLRAAGGILIGKTVMTTFGTSPLGWNADFQGPINPHNASHYTGGSSGGSGVAVAAGIVPVAIGLDAGGSIRLPAAFNGIIGLAPTFGRVPFDSEGADVMSTIKIGPLAVDAASAAIAYSILAQPEPGHFYTTFYGGQGPPLPHLAGFNNIASLQGIKLGIFPSHFEDASDAMVDSCRKAVQTLKDLGATVVEVHIPHMKVLSLAHALIVGSEMSSMHDLEWWLHRAAIMPDTKINLALFRSFHAKEFVSALRLRAWALRWVQQNVFSQVDVYVSPTSGVTAPALPEAAKAYGESNSGLVMKVMRFMFLCNLLGNPGLTVPVGYEASTSLPTSLHLMADHWQEAKLLRLANALQAKITHRRPVNVDLQSGGD